MLRVLFSIRKSGSGYLYIPACRRYYNNHGGSGGFDVCVHDSRWSQQSLFCSVVCVSVLAVQMKIVSPYCSFFRVGTSYVTCIRHMRCNDSTDDTIETTESHSSRFCKKYNPQTQSRLRQTLGCDVAKFCPNSNPSFFPTLVRIYPERCMDECFCHHKPASNTTASPVTTLPGGYLLPGWHIHLLAHHLHLFLSSLP